MEITLEDVQDPSRGMITLVEEQNVLMVEVVVVMVEMMKQAASYIY